MDIAATGLALPILVPVRDRQQARPDIGQQANTRNNRDASSGNAPAESVSRNERVVRGEVIYARPEQGRAVDAAQTSVAGSATSFTSSNPRRLSMQGAIQTFRDNEALVTEPGQSRQVSGIIDEYV